MKTTQILTIISLSCLLISLVSSFISKIPIVVKNAFFLVAVILLATSQVVKCKPEKFIDSSSGNVLDFVEIGTSDFNTEIEKADNNTRGISVEPLRDYLERLPNKKMCVKENVAISDERGSLYMYFVSKEDIAKFNLPDWLRGCNSLGKPHESVERILNEKNLQHIYKTSPVKVITFEDLMRKYNVKKINFLKIDTEGHDPIILQSMINYCDSNPSVYPRTIKFETCGISNSLKEQDVIQKLKKRGYKVVSKGDDTVLKK